MDEQEPSDWRPASLPLGLWLRSSAGARTACSQIVLSEHVAVAGEKRRIHAEAEAGEDRRLRLKGKPGL
jgi:hypothetical protein